MSRGITSLGSLVLILGLFATSRAEAQVFVERGVPPRSVRELLTKTGGLIVGQVVGVSEFVLPDPDDSRPLPYPMTRYTVLITEVIKSEPNLGGVGASVGVVQAGTAEGTTEIGLEGLFKEGDEIVVAVSWWPRGAVYGMPYGADSVFELKDGAVHQRGQSPLAVFLGQLTREECLAELRAAAR